MVAGVILFFAASGGSYFILAAAGSLFGFAMGAVVLVPLCAAAYYGRRDFAKGNALVGMGNALGGAIGVTLYGVFYDMTGTYYTSLITLAVCVVVIVITGELGEITAKPLKAEFTTGEEAASEAEAEA
jgi:MFS family permease